MPEFTNRGGFERDIAERLGQEYTRVLDQLLADIRAAGETLHTVNFELLQENFEAWVQLQLETVYIESAQAYQSNLSFGIADDLLLEAAEGWAQDRARMLVNGLNRTTSQRIRRYVNQFRDGGMTNETLIQRLTTFMSPDRAELAAITEVTRAASEGQEFVARQLRKEGITMNAIWNTLVDERVCPVCSPRNGQQQGTNWFDLPPAHPKCRCFVTYEVIPNEL